MNREIKFRAWDDVNKEMVYPIKPDINISGRASWWILKSYEHVMQSTGLVDTRGNEIYEGDVVKLDENPDAVKGTEFHNSEDVSHHRIYWDSERAMFWDARLEDGDSLCGHLDGDISFVVDCEIVGNIYQNPEFIEKYQSQC
jgi:uncharacterized phage protein (TIGR01671 family)